jgi:hypothetical protein
VRARRQPRARERVFAGRVVVEGLERKTLCLRIERRQETDGIAGAWLHGIVASVVGRPRVIAGRFELLGEIVVERAAFAVLGNRHVRCTNVLIPGVGRRGLLVHTPLPSAGRSSASASDPEA